MNSDSTTKESESLSSNSDFSSDMMEYFEWRKT